MKLIAWLRDLIFRIAEIQSRIHKIQEALGRIESRQVYDEHYPALAECEFQTFSQWGEDGFIQALLREISIEREIFVEFGVTNYNESNTRFLLVNNNWSGLVIDGGQDYIDYIKNDSIYWQHNLKAECHFITRDNINEIFRSNGIVGEIGLLSVDIDGNDYWVWEAIDSISPVIVVAEYNAVFGDRHALSVPYRDDFRREEAHYSHLYFGASLKALIKLGKQKGYTFVGTASNGCNAFFVRDDQAEKVLAKFDGPWAYPSLVRESRNEQGALSFVAGGDRGRLIEDLPLIDVETGKDVSLKDFPELFSREWSEGKKVSA